MSIVVKAPMSATTKPKLGTATATANATPISPARSSTPAAGSGWVRPSRACALELPTEAFRSQRNALRQLYEMVAERWNETQGLRHVVFLPAPIESALITHSGLKRMKVQDFLQVLLPMVGGSLLSPHLLALAEYADRWPDQWQPQEREQWRAKLANVSWVPLAESSNHVPPSAGNEALPLARVRE